MRKKLFEDLLLNKLNGYYLILYGNNHQFLAKMVFGLTQATVFILVHTHFIKPREMLVASGAVGANTIRWARSRRMGEYPFLFNSF